MRVPNSAVGLVLASAGVVVVGLVAGLAFAVTRSAPAAPAQAVAGVPTGVACQGDGTCLAVTSAGAAES